MRFCSVCCLEYSLTIMTVTSITVTKLRYIEISDHAHIRNEEFCWNFLSMVLIVLKLLSDG
jgi:hypothetical protein